MTTAKDIINQAKLWLGKKESDGTFKVIIDTYNAHEPLARSYKVKYTDEWCATFISALAIKCGATDIIPTECGCEPMIKLCKAKGIWIENENRKPNVGDIIFYDWQDDGKGDNKGWSDHVGIVEKVSNGKITVIEGNISSKVERRTIEVNAKCIRGYATPKYEAEAVKALKYKKGDTVKINGVYTSSTSTDKKRPLKNQGKITDIKEDKPNPYLLEEGNIGWVNDECITGKVAATQALDLNAIAKEVRNGVYGNEPDRTKKLKAKGLTAAQIKEVQKLVNKMFK